MAVQKVDPVAVGRSEADVLAVAEQVRHLGAEDLNVGEGAGRREGGG